MSEDTLFKKLLKFKGLWDNVIVISQMSQDLNYLFPDNHEKYHQAYWDSRLLNYMIEAMRIAFFLKLYNLLEPSEKGNIHSFIKNILSTHKRTVWVKLISLKELQTIEKRLEKMISTTSFKTVVWYRNKNYAHQDPDFNDTQLKTDLKEVIEIIVEPLAVIMKLLNTKVFKIPYGLILEQSEICHNLIEDISQINAIRELITRYEKDEKKESITIAELKKCLNKYPVKY